MGMISVVVPVYNELDGVAELHVRLTATLATIGAYEIVIVDDGSTDGTWDRLAVLAAGDPHVRLIRLSRNFGHQAALSAGLREAHGEAVVLIDGDLQDPPEVIPQLVSKWREGFDVVYGVRASREGEPAWRLVAISTFYRLLGRITTTAIPPNVGDFRILSRRAADALLAMPERARFLRGMTSWIGFRQVGVCTSGRPATPASRSTRSASSYGWRPTASRRSLRLRSSSSPASASCSSCSAWACSAGRSTSTSHRTFPQAGRR